MGLPTPDPSSPATAPPAQSTPASAGSRSQPVHSACAARATASRRAHGDAPWQDRLYAGLWQLPLWLLPSCCFRHAFVARTGLADAPASPDARADQARHTP